jgi:hypothetical protein
MNDNTREAQLTPDEAAQAAIDQERERRLWLKAAAPFLQLRTHESDPSDRVQLALDLMTIAVCERVARISRSDLPADRG